VVRIDGAVIGDGGMGPLTSRLLDYYVDYVGEGAAAPVGSCR
jgi:hypothetical protein